MSESGAVIACQLASAPRYIPGREVNCRWCGTAIFVSDETRKAAEGAHLGQVWFGCEPCVFDYVPGEEIALSPLARVAADLLGATHYRGRRLRR